MISAHQDTVSNERLSDIAGHLHNINPIRSVFECLNWMGAEINECFKIVAKMEGHIKRREKKHEKSGNEHFLVDEM